MKTINRIANKYTPRVIEMHVVLIYAYKGNGAETGDTGCRINLKNVNVWGDGRHNNQ